MNLLSAENITKIYGEKTLFSNVNIGIGEGERIALIGINGSGKTSLLKILAGLDAPDSGTVAVRKGTSLGFLGQNPAFAEDKTVFDNVFTSNHPLISLIKDYELHTLSDVNAPDYEQKMHVLVEKMTVQNAWEYEQQIKEIISRLGIGEMVQQKVRFLSGGQRKRVAMAKVLIEAPDILILDEPTNHLDLETVEWLENLIDSKFKTIFLVSHDRYFLDKVTNQIVEIDKGEIYRYKGNYAYFLEKKAEREMMRDVEIEKARQLLKKELEWMRRQPKARTTKAKYRINAFEDVKAKAQRQESDGKIELQMKTTRLGGKTIHAKNITKRFGDNLLVNKFSHNFQKGEKVGIVGKNGVGKTTFLNMLTGLLAPDTGVVDMGETAVIGYYRQEEVDLNPQKRVIEIAKDIAEVVELANGDKITASQFLQMFLFPPQVQFNYVGNLSGGERRRLQLLKTLIKNPNFLILDEPTNDLDIGTLNILEEFLENFGGTLVLVSHDRYFMDRLVEHLFVFEGNGEIKDFPGNYTEYREWKQDKEEEEKAARKQAEAQKQSVNQVETRKSVVKKRRSFKENQEFEKLSIEIDEMEQEKQSLSLLLNEGVADYEKLMFASKRIEELNDLLDEKGLRWLELGEME